MHISLHWFFGFVFLNRIIFRLCYQLLFKRFYTPSDKKLKKKKNSKVCKIRFFFFFTYRFLGRTFKIHLEYGLKIKMYRAHGGRTGELCMLTPPQHLIPPLIYPGVYACPSLILVSFTRLILVDVHLFRTTFNKSTYDYDQNLGFEIRLILYVDYFFFFRE